MQQILLIHQRRTNTTKSNVKNTEERKLYKAKVPYLLEAEFRDHINCFTFDIFRYSCEESPRSLQSASNHSWLQCALVSWICQPYQRTEWLIVCVCVCVGVGVHVGVCVRVKAGTNPPNKHVSSHLWLDPAGNQDSTLQMLLLYRKSLLHAGKARGVCCLSASPPVRLSAAHMSRSPQPLRAVLPLSPLSLPAALAQSCVFSNQQVWD